MNRYRIVVCIIAIVSILISGCTSNGSLSEKVNKEMEVKKEDILKNVKKETPNVKSISLQKGNLISTINYKNTKMLERNLEKFKVVKKINKRKKVGIVKPVTKVVVGKNFLIDQIEKTNDIDINDPGVKSQWAVSYTNSNEVWGLVEQEKVVRIAVIDTGVDYNHPDLKNRVVKESGYDFVNDDDDPMDDNGHGTHVAGIIAAEANNEEGIAGVVGNLDVEIIPIKVLDKDGVGYSDTISKGIEYAVNKGVNIINLSLGGTEKDEDIENAVKYALENCVAVIAAAGNDKQNCDEYTPAGVKGVYTVAASNPLNRVARFSNFGESIDITAPGVKILSTVPDGGYEAWDGTSMAAPVVSGVAAVIIAHDPTIDIDELKDILKESSKDIMKEGEDIFTGSGLINAKKAFEILTENE